MATKTEASRKTVTRFSRSANTRSKTKSSPTTYFRFGESYTSLVFGIIVVIVAAFLLVAFVRNRNIGKIDNAKQEISSDKTEINLQAGDANKFPQTYIVKQGDDLWKIAENTYKSGYAWVDIARANNIENPNLINEGMRLTLPKVSEEKLIITKNGEGKIVSQSNTNATSNRITGSSYVIVSGDTLWDIANRAYGDPYRWVELARVNNLANPDLIYPNTKLQIPR